MKRMSLAAWAFWGALAALAGPGCAQSTSDPVADSNGPPANGAGNSGLPSGGSASAGTAPGGGTTALPGGGSAPTGQAGSALGGASAAGAGAGGTAPSTAGSAGTSSGGSATGGTATAGSASGGNATAGSASGGNATAGSASGGSATAGSSAGGSSANPDCPTKIDSTTACTLAVSCPAATCGVFKIGSKDCNCAAASGNFSCTSCSYAGKTEPIVQAPATALPDCLADDTTLEKNTPTCTKGERCKSLDTTKSRFCACWDDPAKGVVDWDCDSMPSSWPK